MTVPVYSTNFIAELGLVGAISLTVPSTEVYVIRDIDVYADGAISVPFTYVFAHGANGQAFFYYQWEPGTQAWEQWRGRQVMSPGTTWDVTSSNGAVDVTVSGYILTLP
jgi:hypothetical protein